MATVRRLWIVPIVMGMTNKAITARRERGQYWDRAWSLTSGCTPISPGCAHCSAAAETHMRSRRCNPDGWLTTDTGVFNGIVRVNTESRTKPLFVRRPTVWVTLNDLFHEHVSDDQIKATFSVMDSCQQHTFFVLTKRSSRMRQWCNLRPVKDVVPPGRNLWLGVTCEDQRHADKRIPDLLGTPAAHRYLNIEPLLEPISLYLPAAVGIDLIIVGCEFGPKRRPCDPKWILSIVEQCKTAGVPCVVKQVSVDGRVSYDPSEWPCELRVRQWPETTA